MFVLTVDQVDSRSSEDDLVAAVLTEGAVWRDRGAVLGPDRTAGDEFQLLFPVARDALEAALRLTRGGRWSVGIGAGEVREPLPESAGAGRGEAFVAARSAVEAAKRVPQRLVVSAEDATAAAGVTALIGLLVELRARRSPEGWEVADLLAEGITQAQAAERLGVTPQAVSGRARAAAVRLEQEALPPLAAALAALDPPPRPAAA